MIRIARTDAAPWVLARKSEGLLFSLGRTEQNSPVRRAHGGPERRASAFDAGKERLDRLIARPLRLGRAADMEARRKPLAKVEGRRRLRRSGLTVAWRGTPSLDDWVAYIASTKSKKLILADHASERKVRNLMLRLQTMPKQEVEKLAKG